MPTGQPDVVCRARVRRQNVPETSVRQGSPATAAPPTASSCCPPGLVTANSSSLPALPGSGLAATLQDVPLKCSVSVRTGPVAEPWVCPTAQMSLADSAVMPSKALPKAPGSGVLVSDHFLPFQCSTYGTRHWPVARGSRRSPPGRSRNASGGGRPRPCAASWDLPRAPTSRGPPRVLAAWQPVNSTPEAHTSLAPIAVTPVGTSSCDTLLPRLGVGTMVQVWPFQCAAMFKLPGKPKPSGFWVPTAHTSLGDRAASPVTPTGSSEKLPAGPGTVCQLVPSKCSKNALSPAGGGAPRFIEPATHTSSGLVPATAVSVSAELPGVLAICQWVPFQCSTRPPDGELVSGATSPRNPTAQASVEPRSATPCSRTCRVAGWAIATCCQLVPFHRSASARLTTSRGPPCGLGTVVTRLPTAHPSLALVSDTPNNALCVLAAACGLTVGATCQILLAAIPGRACCAADPARTAGAPAPSTSTSATPATAPVPPASRPGPRRHLGYGTHPVMPTPSQRPVA